MSTPALVHRLRQNLAAFLDERFREGTEDDNEEQASQ
jgi:hypothetical protein